MDKCTSYDLRKAWSSLSVKDWVNPPSKPPKTTAEAKRNLEWVVKEGDDISCSPETRGCGGGYRSSYKPYFSTFPQEKNSVGMLEVSFSDGMNLLPKWIWAVWMVDSSILFRTEALIAQLTSVLSDDSPESSPSSKEPSQLENPVWVWLGGGCNYIEV